MKKKIESELISIAHRLLKLKNPTETVKLQEEVKKLYDQLTILRFYEENTALVNTEFTDEVFNENLEKIIVGTVEIEEEEEEIADPYEQQEYTEVEGLAGKESIININHGVMANEIIAHDALPEIEEEKIDKIVETTEIEAVKTEILVIETPAVEKVENFKTDEPKVEKQSTQEIIGTKATKQISIDDIFVHDYQDSIFEKKSEQTETSASKPIDNVLPNTEAVSTEAKAFGKPIVLGINDKIAFEKNLFNNNTDDLNRVLSQLNTFTSLAEAKSFVLDFVKPDYNNWQGKEEFEKMFLDLIENKFK